MAFGTQTSKAGAQVPPAVSILVFLEWPLGRRPGDVERVAGTQFQSLFFWNGLWDGAARIKGGKQTWRFNPCFSGMAFGTGNDIARASAINVFQSLFFWNGLWDTDFIGGEGFVHFAFQSLFFWNGLWDAANVIRAGGALRVSILVFLEWPLGRSVRCRPCRPPKGFNPCFSGMAFGTKYGRLVRAIKEGFQSLFFWNGLWDVIPPGP